MRSLTIIALAGMAALMLRQSARRAKATRALQPFPEMTAWPELPEGCTWSPSDLDLKGLTLSLSPLGVVRLRVDRRGRLSSTGRPLMLRLPVAPRGGHAA